MKKILSLVTLTMLLLNQVAATVVPIIDEVIDSLPSNDEIETELIYVSKEINIATSEGEAGDSAEDPSTTTPSL
jgi:hypothetical protein